MRSRLFVAFSAALVAAVVLAASPAFAQVPLTVNYTFDIPVAKITPNPCTGGFTLVSGTAHLAIGATTSTTGFQLRVKLGSVGNGIDVSSSGTPVVTGLAQYLYGSDVGATTTFPDGVPEYFERTVTVNDFLIRDSPIETNDSYTMNTTLRLIFSNGLPSVPVIDSVSVECQ